MNPKKSQPEGRPKKEEAENKIVKNDDPLTVSGIENVPHPSAMVEGMRSIGYSPQTAIADLVDNSITAESRNISITIFPSESEREGGFIYVEDDGNGMSSEGLFEAMRWGGKGPKKTRKANDLGRFGLGLKTASFSMGRKLTVATRDSGGLLKILCWDLGHMETAGWKMQEGLDMDTKPIFARSSLAKNPKSTGTIVIITKLDRLTVRSSQLSNTEKNSANITKKISAHLGMTFHRFIEDGVKIKLGSSEIRAWDPFYKATSKHQESLGPDTKVTSYVLPHHSTLTNPEHDHMAGPKGWNAHQGFLVYRAKRLIMQGGWLGLFDTSESCRLARIRIDLKNNQDEGWDLDVIKSKVSPPSWQIADLQRIGEASRRDSQTAFNFRGSRQAPSSHTQPDITQVTFWHQLPSVDAVKFRINRAHPVIQSLKQSIKDPEIAEGFIKMFERMLPLDAILQDPKRTTNGSSELLNSEEIGIIAELARRTIKVLMAQGNSEEKATSIVLSSEPFIYNTDAIRRYLKNN
jgi:hypothetical protein